MVRFNTTFLLKATVVTALACLPMAVEQQSGFVWTAFLLPVCWALLAAKQVEQRREFEFNFRMLPNSVLEISTGGGRYHQWTTRGRIIVAGICLSIVFGFPMLHQVDPGPLGLWVPIAASFALFAVALFGCSLRRTVLKDERELVTEYLLFGRLCWRRQRWQVREGDFLTVLATSHVQEGQKRVLLFHHGLFVGRSQKRQAVAYCMTTSEQVVPGMEFAAQLVAQLMEIPYEGYEFKKIPL